MTTISTAQLNAAFTFAEIIEQGIVDATTDHLFVTFRTATGTGEVPQPRLDNRELQTAVANILRGMAHHGFSLIHEPPTDPTEKRDA